MADLQVLLERVKMATGPDRELDADIFVALVPGHKKTMELGFECLVPCLWELRNGQWHDINDVRLTSSIDAAVALVERVLPGWAHAHISEKLRGCIGYVHNNETAFEGMTAAKNPKRQWYEQRAATPPLAVLAALFFALINGGR